MISFLWGCKIANFSCTREIFGDCLIVKTPESGMEKKEVGVCSDLSSLSEMLSLVRTSDSKHYVSFKTPTLLISRSPCGGKRHPRARSLKGTVTS